MMMGNDREEKSDEPLQSSIELREGVVVNAVWQFLAQFSRRYAQKYFFTFEQVHPGSSIGGLLNVNLNKKIQNCDLGESIGVLQFHIGGPNRGSLIVGTTSKPIDHTIDIGKERFVHALLSSKFARVYEQTASALDLPRWNTPLPEANRFAISLQFISLIQNVLATSRHEFRPICGSHQHSLSSTGQTADFHRRWAYQYFDKELPPGVEFVGMTDEESSGLLTVVPFDQYAANDADFVLHTSEARIRLKQGDALGEHIDIANLYRNQRTKFFELAAAIAFRILKNSD